MDARGNRVKFGFAEGSGRRVFGTAISVISALNILERLPAMHQFNHRATYDAVGRQITMLQPAPIQAVRPKQRRCRRKRHGAVAIRRGIDREIDDPKYIPKRYERIVNCM